MHVRLTRKLAQYIDGVDLTHHVVGEVFELQPAQADLLVAEGWAEHYTAVVPTLDRIRQVRSRLDRRWLTQTQSRRAEDRIREELRDSRARTVNKTAAGL